MVWHSSALLVVNTIPLNDSKRGLIMMLKIQNFQFWRVRLLIYSLNFSCMWSKRCRVLGTPVAGSCSWHRFMEALSSSISSRNLLTSSCICCLSCWSFPMCSTVFCNVTALLIFDWDLSVGTRLQSVLKPMFMFDLLFCSADMCVVLRLWFCSFFTRGVLLLLISDWGLGT